MEESQGEIQPRRVSGKHGGDFSRTMRDASLCCYEYVVVSLYEGNLHVQKALTISGRFGR